MYCTTNLGGGLGNQLFQAAHVKAQSIKNNVEAIFTKTLNPHSNIDYSDNIFRNLKFTEHLTDYRVYSEQNWNNANIQAIFDTNIYFHGYFQSSLNFLGLDDMIRETFSPTKDFIDNIYCKYTKLSLSNTLSLHIRRGDYLSISNILPVVSKEYIDKCVSDYEYDHIFIFSDDKEWCNKNLNYKNSTIVTGLLDYEEMWMMSLCTNHIISNSTFSWWGAWLNNNKKSIITAPEIWFGPHKYTQDIDEWYNIYEKKWKIKECIFKDGFLY